MAILLGVYCYCSFPISYILCVVRCAYFACNKILLQVHVGSSNLMYIQNTGSVASTYRSMVDLVSPFSIKRQSRRLVYFFLKSGVTDYHVSSPISCCPLTDVSLCRLNCITRYALLADHGIEVAKNDFCIVTRETLIGTSPVLIEVIFDSIVLLSHRGEGSNERDVKIFRFDVDYCETHIHTSK